MRCGPKANRSPRRRRTSGSAAAAAGPRSRCSRSWWGHSPAAQTTPTTPTTPTTQTMLSCSSRLSPSGPRPTSWTLVLPSVERVAKRERSGERADEDLGAPQGRPAVRKVQAHGQPGAAGEEEAEPGDVSPAARPAQAVNGAVVGADAERDAAQLPEVHLDRGLDHGHVRVAGALVHLHHAVGVGRVEDRAP